MSCLERLVGVERAGPGGERYLTRTALVLATEPALAAAVQAHGKSHADALLIGQQDGRTVLEPVDFKWTLETANPKQVGAEVLGELLADPPALLAARLAELLRDLPGDAPLHHDGIFLAPDHAANRAQLAPSGPLDPEWAVLCAVDATEFFSPLPGWDVAAALARLDGAYLGTLESAEKYYRLGAGVLGALRRLRAGIFAETPADLDGPPALAELRRDRRLNTTGEVIAFLDRALTARGELVDKLREVERAGYPFGRFRQDLTERGVAAGGPSDRRWGRLYGSIMKVVGEQVRAEGRALVAAGRSELGALGELDKQRPRWLAIARRELDQRLPSRSAPATEGHPASADPSLPSG
ncbi:MAG: hypothetical protein M3O34_13740 [Chloroflexota bacterium]|nr:hypothetical protein [Chloroflexota bacterium]